jgi:hypothetical protein
MARGILGTADANNGSLATIYTVPADNFAVVSINVCNRNATAQTVKVALTSDPAAVQANEYIEFNTELLGNGVLERTGIVIDAGKSIVAEANSADLGVVVFGIETSTI